MTERKQLALRAAARQPPLAVDDRADRALIDTDALYRALDVARAEKGLSWRGLAADAGLNPSLFTRLQRGKKPGAEHFLTMVRWLGVPAETFVPSDPAAAHQPPLAVDDPRRIDHTMTVLGTALREAGPWWSDALYEAVNHAMWALGKARGDA